MSHDHRAEALAALRYWNNAEDSGTAISYASEGMVHALLYAGDQLAALVEQQRLQLLVSVSATAAVPLSDHDYAAIQARIRAGLGLENEAHHGT